MQIASTLWPRLRNSRAEALAVAALFGDRAELLLENDATADAVIKMNADGHLAQFADVLISVHGHFNPSAPEHAALILAPAAKSATASALFAHDVMGLRLNSKLAFLSACSTGLGSVDASDGLYGLPYALLVAGNGDTIASLWQVRDREAAQFVTRFFRYTQRGWSHRQALASTKRDWRRSGGHSRTWAAFVLFGG